MSLLEYCRSQRDEYLAFADNMEFGNERIGRNGVDSTAQEITTARRIVAEMEIEIARHS